MPVRVWPRAVPVECWVEILLRWEVEEEAEVDVFEREAVSSGFVLVLC